MATLRMRPTMKQLDKNLLWIVLYFAISLVLIFAEYFKAPTLISVCKPLLMPTLIILYLRSSNRIQYAYLAALLFALASNVFLLFPDNQSIFYGIVLFLFYRLATIITVVQVGDIIALLPLALATVPFLFIFSYLIYIMVSPENPSFYAALLNNIIISIFSGMGLSIYIMNDNKANSWLIISTLLFTILVVLFMFENFYLPNPIFKPLSAFVFSIAHMAFYKFVVESEHQT